MCLPRINTAARLIAGTIAGIAFSAALGGCSDIYFDRRDAITLGAGDAIAANEAQQTVDPWSPQSGNPNIGFSGQRMQAAIERYRTGKVVEAVDSQAATSTAQAQAVTQISIGSGGAPGGATSTTSDTSTTTTTTSGQ
jgi:hypothetical protein